MNPQVDRSGAYLFIARGPVEVGLGAQIVVDILRIDLRLSIHARLVHVAAVQLDQLDGLYFQHRA